jgi:AraC-like DNA-binding protein
MSRTTPIQQAQYGRFADTGIEVLHARFEHHRFTTHAHDTWAIGAVLRGAKDSMTRSRQPAIVTAGEVYAIAPHTAHAGQSIGDAGCEYVMLYVPDAEWRRACDLHGVSAHALSRPVPMQHAIEPFAQFAALSMRGAQPSSAWPDEWALLCETMLGTLNQPDVAAHAPAIAADSRLRDARAYLQAFSSRNVPLDELAREASLSASELCRRFTAAFGLSPHRYQLVLRLEAAKQGLLDGMTPSDVAAATGFADQSHLGRHFKAVFGVTPGAVARRNSAKTF